MSETGGMLDTYLLAQALGWEWNIWTIIILDGTLILLFIIIICIVGLLGVYFKWW